MRYSPAIFVLLTCLPACAQPPATRPGSPIQYVHEQRDSPPMHLHVATVDLADPAVRLLVRRAGDDPDGEGSWNTTLMHTSQIAERDHLDVAVNGDFFIPKDALVTPLRKVPYYIGNWATPCGWAMSDGVTWCTRPAPASLMVDEHGRVTIGRIGARPPQGTRQIVSGMAQIVTGGRNTGADDPVAPHTAAGVTKDGKTLVLLVVDGRRPEYSAGMTLHQLANEMIRLGCDSAIQLDGGGSSTMVLYDEANDRYDIVNRPSDGHDLPLAISVERAVANVLGVRVDNKRRGTATRPATQPNTPGPSRGRKR
jgi:hypothetical protein